MYACVCGCVWVFMCAHHVCVHAPRTSLHGSACVPTHIRRNGVLVRALVFTLHCFTECVQVNGVLAVGSFVQSCVHTCTQTYTQIIAASLQWFLVG